MRKRNRTPKRVNQNYDYNSRTDSITWFNDALNTCLSDNIEPDTFRSRNSALKVVHKLGDTTESNTLDSLQKIPAGSR